MPVLKAKVNFRGTLRVLWRGLAHLSIASAIVTAAILSVTSAADAGITKIQIISRGPAFGGYSFAKVGAYERIIGKGFGEVSPTDRHNDVIVDLGLAPRNANGKVEYSFDFYILKPADLSKGNHKVFYEAPNRGSKLFGNFNRSTGGNDPSTSSDPAGTFLAPQGYTMVWSGWDFGAGADNSNFNLTITLPIAKNPDGSSISGPAYEYIVSPGASYTFAVSQPGRMLNDFRNLGFNEDENGRIVFDGLLQWIAAGDGINMNYRFSQPGRTERNRQDQLYIEGVFPFAHQRLTDPISGKTAGRYDKCAKTKTCPLGMEVYSANEYWVKAASLFTTDPSGKMDLPDHPMARYYFISSEQHGTGNPTAKGNCQQFQNPLDSAPVLRALWVALDEWSTKGIAPPPSAVPRLAEGTLVTPLPQSRVGFPKIPGVTYTGLMSTRYLLNYGPQFYSTGVMKINPPAVRPPIFNNPENGPIYPSYVPKTDADGNDIAGVRLPDVTAPLATYTGWALRSGPQANDGCEAAGQYIPFPKTKAERMNSGDPRLSVEERYPSLSAYSSAVEKAIDEMIAKRLMLPEDGASNVNRLLRVGTATGALKSDASSGDIH